MTTIVITWPRLLAHNLAVGGALEEAWGRGVDAVSEQLCFSSRACVTYERLLIDLGVDLDSVVLEPCEKCGVDP